MIQDIYPHKLINHFEPSKTPSLDDTVIHFKGQEVLILDKENTVQYPTLREFLDCEAGSAEADLNTSGSASEEELLVKAKDAVGTLQYLFTVDETDLYLARDKEIPVPEGYKYIPRLSLRSDAMLPKEMVFAAFTAQQLAGWYRDNVFCGTCGSRTEHSKTERAMVCPNCGRTIYPRILPAVIVAVRSGDGQRILLTKYANRPFANFALIAGLTEIGETIEETVSREVMEEVGLKVKNLRYYKSQPWGIADDILMGFFCTVDGDETISIDRNELKLGAWFTRDEVQLQPTNFSLTNEMMRRFKEGEDPEI